MKPVMDAKRVFTVAKFVFFIVGVLSLATIINNIKITDGITLLKDLAWVIFYFSFSAYFSYLQGKETHAVTNDKEMEKIAKLLDKA